MPTATRSLFGSIKDKISRKSSSRSPSPNPRPCSPIYGCPDPFLPEDLTRSVTVCELPATSSPAPPPPYSAIAPPAATTPTSPSSAAAAPPPSIHIARAASPSPSFASALSGRSITTPEDPYAFLGAFDTIFLIDDSGSMAGASWRETRDALRAIAPICTAHDDNGIDVYFLNARNPSQRTPTSADGTSSPTAGGFLNLRTPSQIESLFHTVRPRGGTPTGTRIGHILKPYLRAYERAVARTGNPEDCGVKPVNMIVVTDGVPTDDPESVILSLARKLDALEAPPHQVGIQFFQVGREPGAAEALRELDDGLVERGGGDGMLRDMVDTVTWDGRNGARNVLSAEAILKVVLGAVVKRLDRRRMSGEGARPVQRDRLGV